MTSRALRSLPPGLLVLLALLLSPGCATRSGSNWTDRVGVYTYDEAVRELGPPDKKEATSDGILVAEWVLVRGRVYSSPGMAWGPGSWWGPAGWGGWGMVTEVNSAPDQLLRLQFDADGRLLEWKRFHR